MHPHPPNETFSHRYGKHCVQKLAENLKRFSNSEIEEISVAYECYQEFTREPFHQSGGHRLDQYYEQNVFAKLDKFSNQHPELSDLPPAIEQFKRMVRLSLSLYHGQADVERGK